MNIATASTIKVQLRGLIGFTRSTVKVQLKGQKEFKTHELHNYIYFPSKLGRITSHSLNPCPPSGLIFLTAITILFPLLDCPLSLSQPLTTRPNAPSPITVSRLKFLVASFNSVKLKILNFGVGKIWPSIISSFLELLLSVSDPAGGNSDEQENCARGDWLDSEQLSLVSVSEMVGGNINGMEKLVVMVMEGFVIIIS